MKIARKKRKISKVETRSVSVKSGRLTIDPPKRKFTTLNTRQMNASVHIPYEDIEMYAVHDGIATRMLAAQTANRDPAEPVSEGGILQQIREIVERDLGRDMNDLIRPMSAIEGPLHRHGTVTGRLSSRAMSGILMEDNLEDRVNVYSVMEFLNEYHEALALRFPNAHVSAAQHNYSTMCIRFRFMNDCMTVLIRNRLASYFMEELERSTHSSLRDRIHRAVRMIEGNGQRELIRLHIESSRMVPGPQSSRT